MEMLKKERNENKYVKKYLHLSKLCLSTFLEI